MSIDTVAIDGNNDTIIDANGLEPAEIAYLRSFIDSIKMQKKIINERVIKIATNQETGELVEMKLKSAKKAIEMEFKMKETCWAKLFEVTDVHEDYAPVIQLKDILNCTKKKIPFASFAILPNFDHYHLQVTLYDSQKLITSKILAVHTSSGSMSINGYSHVNFLTQNGSIYYGSGEAYDNDESLNYCKLLPMYLNPL